MTTTDPILTIGELTIDDVVVEDVGVDWKQPGGGALYSAIGALLWHGSAAVSAAVGPDYPREALDRFGSLGIDTSAVHRTDECNSLGLWLLYEASGERHQYEKAAGGTFAQLDALRPSARPFCQSIAGVHLAPQTSAGHLKAMADYSDGAVPITLDLLVESYIDTDPYRDGSALHGITALLPSQDEVRAIWGDVPIRDLASQLGREGGDRWLVVKQGARGVSLIVDNRVLLVPSVAEDVVDVTGAGDAFCGGFLAGLIETSDPVEAAMRGVVSSSFVVQTRGALAAISALDERVARRRLRRSRNQMECLT